MGSMMPCRLRVGLRAMRPSAGSCAVASLETGTESPHQECPRGDRLEMEEDTCSSFESIRTRVHRRPSRSTVTNGSSASCWCARIVDNASDCCAGRRSSNHGCARSKARRVLVHCSPSSSCVWARRSWMCRPRCRHGPARSAAYTRCCARCGCTGQWRDLLDDAAVRRYGRRVSELVASDLATWAHHGALGD